MQTYDVVLKQLLTSSNAFIHQLAHVTVQHWLNVELPQTQNPRIDLLCETTEGIPLHIELQNSNDSLMALRMAEYALQIYRRLERFPQQIVLYTGNVPLTMPSGLQSPSFSSQFALVDIRNFDGEALLASTTPEENILSVLMRLRDQRAALRQILQRIATLETGERKIAYEQLGILAGLRALVIFSKRSPLPCPSPKVFSLTTCWALSSKRGSSKDSSKELTRAPKRLCAA